MRSVNLKLRIDEAVLERVDNLSSVSEVVELNGDGFRVLSVSLDQFENLFVVHEIGIDPDSPLPTFKRLEQRLEVMVLHYCYTNDLISWGS